MICTSTIGREYTLFVRLVDDAMLLDKSACRTHKSALMCLHDQAIRLATVLTLVLLDIFLSFRQLVLFSFILSLYLHFPLLFIFLVVLFREK